MLPIWEKGAEVRMAKGKGGGGRRVRAGSVGSRQRKVASKMAAAIAEAEAEAIRKEVADEARSFGFCVPQKPKF